MQDDQSAGAEQKNVSQNGRAQNIHCDNVTPLSLGNWRIIFSTACKRTLHRNSLLSNSQRQRPPGHTVQEPGPDPGEPRAVRSPRPPPGPHAQSNGRNHCQLLFLSYFSNLGWSLLLERKLSTFIPEPCMIRNKRRLFKWFYRNCNAEIAEISAKRRNC